MGRCRQLAFLVAIGSVAAILLSPADASSDPNTIGDYQAWSAATFADDDTPTCYAVSTPIESTPQNVRRGEIYVMVSRRSSERTDELILASGYPFKPGTAASVSIGTSKFALTTGNEFAWMRVGDGVAPLVKAMMGGQQMIVAGVSARGTQTTDKYSLLGFTAAYQAIVKSCK